MSSFLNRLALICNLNSGKYIHRVFGMRVSEVVGQLWKYFNAPGCPTSLSGGERRFETVGGILAMKQVSEVGGGLVMEGFT